jgi:hypothetical protein
VNVLWFSKADAQFQTAGNSQDQQLRPLFFAGAMQLDLKDFCGADEIGG